jgi:hypothetical protein
MGNAMHLLPVQCDTHRGFGEMKGVLRFEGTRFSLQHQTRDTVLGVLKSRTTESTIPLDRIVEVRYRWFAWWAWRPTFEVLLNDLNDTTGIPGADGTRLRFALRWSDRHAGRNLADALHAALADHRYRRFSAELDQMTSHPAAAPAPESTSVPPRRAAEGGRASQSE